jgi:hypothetical protein
MSYPVGIMRLDTLFRLAKDVHRSKYVDSADRAWLMQMRTIADVANDSRHMIEQGKDGVAYFAGYLDEIGLDVSESGLIIEECR